MPIWKIMSRPHPTIEKCIQHLVPRGSKLLLGVSGGVDSVVLLHACCALREQMGVSIEVAHLDHGLREESVTEAAFVEALAKSYAVPFHFKKAGPYSTEMNLEAWGRKQRYSFFSEVLSASALDWVLTAHTASDVAETFLMRLVSNKELNTVNRVDLKRRCLRPLLDISRPQIEAYAHEHSLKHVIDASNADTKFLRNRVRHKLIPVLAEEFDERIVEVLSRRAAAVAEDSACLYALIEPALERLSQLEFGSKPWLRLLRSEMSELSQPLKWRLAERVFKEKTAFNLGRIRAMDLVDFLEGKAIGLELPGGFNLRAHGGAIVLTKIKNPQDL